MNEALQKLREPFAAEQIHQLPRVTCASCRKRQCQQHKQSRCQTCGAYVSSAHIHLDYVGHADVTARLLNVDPAWTWEPLGLTAEGLPMFDYNGGLWIKLTVCGVTRLGYGDAQGKSGGDAIKEAIGDALRNGAMRFGVALDLWSKSDITPPESSQPEIETDPIWLEATFDAIKEASATDELTVIAGEIKDRKEAGQLNPDDRTRLMAAWSARKKEL